MEVQNVKYKNFIMVRLKSNSQKIEKKKSAGNETFAISLEFRVVVASIPQTVDLCPWRSF